ncbi:DUF1534 domain-containing protein [Pseudomonas congelans]|nr:DUF1534 domain-containing protein [Pseudomonas congelans]QVX17315.1 DUF1534 domain-containing protein [Pseudomonas congelans]
MSVLTHALSFRTLQRGNAFLDALRPTLSVRSDAERHELHANAEHWHESQFPAP